MADEPRYCEDCRWYQAVPLENHDITLHECTHEQATLIRREDTQECWDMRHGDNWSPCGPEGKLWEPKA